MAYYKDFSKYEVCPRYQMKDTDMVENVINIGWLGEDEDFPKGEVSNEFLMNLWEYYKCPIYKTRKIYNNQKLDGYWKFFIATSGERDMHLGRAEIRVVDQKRNVVYASPDLIIHYVINHKYLPPKEFIQAVIEGPKPNTEEFSHMIKQIYKNVYKIECMKEKCPYCKSKYVRHAYQEKRNFQSQKKIEVIRDSTNIVRKIATGEYIYYQMCEDCGRISQYQQ